MNTFKVIFVICALLALSYCNETSACADCATQKEQQCVSSTCNSVTGANQILCVLSCRNTAQDECRASTLQNCLSNEVNTICANQCGADIVCFIGCISNGDALCNEAVEGRCVFPVDPCQQAYATGVSECEDVVDVDKKLICTEKQRCKLYKCQCTKCKTDRAPLLEACKSSDNKRECRTRVLEENPCETCKQIRDCRYQVCQKRVERVRNFCSKLENRKKNKCRNRCNAWRCSKFKSCEDGKRICRRFCVNKKNGTRKCVKKCTCRRTVRQSSRAVCDKCKLFCGKHCHLIKDKQECEQRCYTKTCVNVFGCN